jgi:peptide/nickel transport system permease protein
MTEMSLRSAAIEPGGSNPVNAESDPTPTSLGRVVVREILGRASALVGLIWIGALVFAAVFAPLLCSSFPLLINQHGHYTSPLLENLSPADVILQVAFWSALILRLFPPGRRLIYWLALVALSVAIFPFLIRPPTIIVYETYRQAQARGQIQWAIRAPIPYSPDDHLRDQDVELRLAPPSTDHWAGTTSDSADLLSNLVHASRIALSIGFISTGIALAIGIVAGGIMGFYGGWIDLIGMRIAEIVDSIPQLLLLLIFVAAFPVNLYFIMAIIGLTSWVGYAYFIRAEFLSLRDRDFVQAARAMGLPVWRILFRHMLPNGITPLIVSASFGVATAILTESTLSFLGIGLTNEASWGNLLEQALGEGGTFYWWIALYPGLAIFLTVFAYNMIGEALRDALDPKLLKRP